MKDKLVKAKAFILGKKKLIVSLIVIIAVIGVGTAGFFVVPKLITAKPIATTETFLEAVKLQDFETIKTVYAGNEKIFDISTNDVVNPEYEKQSKDLISEKLLGFQYLVENEVITQPEQEGGEPTATVDVTMTTINLGDAINQALKNFFATLQFGQMDLTELDVKKEVETKVLEKVAAATADYEAKFTLALTKKEGVWLVDTMERNSPFFNGLYGNATSAMPSL